jgi:hypothetical protein
MERPPTGVRIKSGEYWAKAVGVSKERLAATVEKVVTASRPSEEKIAEQH